jgi:hypothetical protein
MKPCVTRCTVECRCHQLQQGCCCSGIPARAIAVAGNGWTLVGIPGCGGDPPTVGAARYSTDCGGEEAPATASTVAGALAGAVAGAVGMCALHTVPTYNRYSKSIYMAATASRGGFFTRVKKP